MAKKFVQISCSNPIVVTAGLQSIDSTNYRSPKADRLSVKPAWTRFRVLIKQGINWYPSEILEWNSVKDLAEQEIISIGNQADTCPNQEEVQELKNKLAKAKAKLDSDTEKAKKIRQHDEELSSELAKTVYKEN